MKLLKVKVVVWMVLVLWFLGCGSLLAQAEMRLTFPSWQWAEPGNKEFLFGLKEAFEKEYPTIKIEPITVPYRAYWDKIFTEISAGTPPDIVTLFDTQICQYLELGFLQPLDKWLDEANIDRTKFARSHCIARRDGKLHGVAFQVNPRAFVYNKRLFAEAGVMVPTNAEDFLEAVKKLTVPEKYQYGFGTQMKPGAVESLYNEMIVLIKGYGGNFSRDGIPTANDAKTVEGVKMIKTLYDLNLIPKGMELSEVRKMFFEEKVASLVTGGFFMGMVDSAVPDLLPYVDVAMPPFRDKSGTALTVFFTMPRDVKDKEAVGKFIQFYLRPEWQRKVVEIIHTSPAMAGAVTEEFLAKYPWFKVFDELSKTASSLAPPGLEAHGAEVKKIVVSHIEDILFTGKSVEAGMNECQKELEELVKRIK